MLKRLFFIFMSLSLMFILVGCGSSGLDLEDAISKGKDYLNELESIHLDNISNEEKIEKIDTILSEIEPTYNELEESKDENEYEFGADFKAWEAYGGIRSAGNALKDYIENDSQDALKDYYKAKHASEDNFNEASNKLNEDS